MKKLTPRLLSLLLSVAMLFSCAALFSTASAAEVPSGRFKSDNKTYLHLLVDWSLVSATQTSAVVEFKVIVSYYSLSLGERSGTLTVGDQKFTFTSGSIVNMNLKYREYVAATFNITVPVRDGKVSVDFDCVWNAKVTYSKVYFENLNVTDTLSFTIPASMLPSITYGDASGDKIVNAVDLLLLRQYLASTDPMTGLSSLTVSAGADANGDGKVNMLDLAVIRSYLAAFDPATGTSPVILGAR